MQDGGHPQPTMVFPAHSLGNFWCDHAHRSLTFGENGAGSIE